jgi:putative endonuclease
MNNTKLSTYQKGNIGENQAVEYLLLKGYSIVNRKYRSRFGEIDCIARDSDGTIVFVEVKSSHNGSLGNPLYWVTPAKQKTITKMATQYIAEHKLNGMPCRFDVIAICKDKIDHLKNAFLAR